MDYACFPNKGDKLSDLVRREYGDKDDASYEATMRRIEQLNPHIPKSSAVPSHTPVLIPDPDGPTLEPVMPEGAALMAILNQLPCESREVLSELNSEEQFTIIAALAGLLDKYDMWQLSGDLNTYGGAGVGNATMRAGGLYKAIDDVDKALLELRKTPKAQQPQQIAKIRQLYKNLHEKFGFELKNILARNASKIKKGHPLMRPQRGINLALGGSKRLPLTNANNIKAVSKFAIAGKVVGKGIIFLDLTLRARIVKNQWETGGPWQRELFGQTAGFGLSFAAAGIAFSLLLGPLGVILAIIVSGAIAVGADYIGQGLGYRVYDGGSYLLQYLRPPYVY